MYINRRSLTTTLIYILLFTFLDIHNSKEKSSSANSTASNNKRKLSSTDEICRKAMGRKMDTVFIGGNIELGCMEIGGRTEDHTKEMQDGSFKMPLVMKDMLVDIVNKTPSLLHDVGITGFCINGNDSNQKKNVCTWL